jgi:hypothetical protein
MAQEMSAANVTASDTRKVYIARAQLRHSRSLSRTPQLTDLPPAGKTSIAAPPLPGTAVGDGAWAGQQKTTIISISAGFLNNPIGLSLCGQKIIYFWHRQAGAGIVAGYYRRS